MYLPPMPFTHSTTHLGSAPIFMSLWLASSHMLSVITPVNVAPNESAAADRATAMVFFIGVLLDTPFSHWWPGGRHYGALLNWVSVGRFYSRTELVDQRAQWKREGKRVVFTNGCYDLLHPGHIRLLEEARSRGDLLILALNSDSSVRRMKGPARPLIGEAERAEMALALEAVDAVTFFDEETPRELIAAVLPDVLIKGADWAHFIAGREEVEAAGGQVLTVALEPGYSTTNIVERILQA